MPPVCFLRVATLQLAVCQRGTPKVEKGEGLIKPDKNRHSLPLFPLRFSPLDSPFLNPLFPHLCRFLPASFPDTQEGADPYQPVAGNNSGAWLSSETGSFPLYIRKCFTKSKCCCREFTIYFLAVFMPHFSFSVICSLPDVPFGRMSVKL